jgi:hypothetical protein
VADWAITTYWGVGWPPDLADDRFDVSHGVAGVRVGFAGDGLWQLDVLRRYGAFVLDPARVPYLFGAAGCYDALWVAAEDVFRPAWNYLVPGDCAAAKMLGAVGAELADVGAVLVGGAGGEPMVCLPDPVIVSRALARFDASGSVDDPGLEARIARALAVAGGHPGEHRGEATFVAGLWTERFGYVGVANLRVEVWAWDWTVTRLLSGERNVLRDGQVDSRGHQWCWDEPVDRPRVRWPFAKAGTRNRSARGRPTTGPSAMPR